MAKDDQTAQLDEFWRRRIETMNPLLLLLVYCCDFCKKVYPKTGVHFARCWMPATLEKILKSLQNKTQLVWRRWTLQNSYSVHEQLGLTSSPVETSRLWDSRVWTGSKPNEVTWRFSIDFIKLRTRHFERLNSNAESKTWLYTIENHLFCMFSKAAPPLCSNNIELGWKGKSRCGCGVTLQKAHDNGPMLQHWNENFWCRLLIPELDLKGKKITSILQK